MTQETRTVNDIIDSAFKLVEIYDEDSTIRSVDFDRAFNQLNLIIDSFSGTETYIPLTKKIEFTTVPNKSSYIFSNVEGIIRDVESNRIAQINYLNINEDNLFYPVRPIKKSNVYRFPYNTSITSRPSSVLLENSEEYSEITFFNTPDKAYNCILRGKFYLNKFVKFEPIRNVPLTIHNFLIYHLAKTLTLYFSGATWKNQAEQIYQDLKSKVIATNDIDYTAKNSNLLNDRFGYYSDQYRY